MFRLFRLTASIGLLLVSTTALADWTLDNASSALSFVSIKNGAVLESHTFTKLSGGVTQKGEATVNIDLASVDTSVPVRDERMQEMLFEIPEFPSAGFAARVPVSDFEALEEGASKLYELTGELSLHGDVIETAIKVLVIRVGRNSFVVTTRKPFIIDASNFDLVEGIEALRNVAGLQAIATSVPVSFTLLFKRS